MEVASGGGGFRAARNVGGGAAKPVRMSQTENWRDVPDQTCEDEQTPPLTSSATGCPDQLASLKTDTLNV